LLSIPLATRLPPRSALPADFIGCLAGLAILVLGLVVWALTAGEGKSRGNLQGLLDWIRENSRLVIATEVLFRERSSEKEILRWSSGNAWIGDVPDGAWPPMVDEAKTKRPFIMKTDGFAAIFGPVSLRWKAHDFGFVEQGQEVGVEWNGKWLEVCGCGAIGECYGDLISPEPQGGQRDVLLRDMKIVIPPFIIDVTNASFLQNPAHLGQIFQLLLFVGIMEKGVPAAQDCVESLLAKFIAQPAPANINNR
jgi:hypothetical protein